MKKIRWAPFSFHKQKNPLQGSSSVIGSMFECAHDLHREALHGVRHACNRAEQLETHWMGLLKVTNRAPA